jgi:hypothetical protein
MIKLGTWLTRKRKPVFLWYDRYKDGREYQGIFYDDTHKSLIIYYTIRNTNDLFFIRLSPES